MLPDGDGSGSLIRLIQVVGGHISGPAEDLLHGERRTWRRQWKNTVTNDSASGYGKDDTVELLMLSCCVYMPNNTT